MNHQTRKKVFKIIDTGMKINNNISLNVCTSRFIFYSATTNSPPTRDTDHYPRSLPADNPLQEIERMQKEMESYLQQIQVIEQKAMSGKLALSCYDNHRGIGHLAFH